MVTESKAPTVWTLNDDQFKTMMVSVREFLERIMDERDKLYDIRFKSAETAINVAIVAEKEKTKAAFDSLEKALLKSDINAEKWRDNANEWRAAMADREARFPSRTEVDAEFKNLRSELSGIKERLDEIGGMAKGNRFFKDDSRVNLALIISALTLLFLLFRTLSGH